MSRCPDIKTLEPGQQVPDGCRDYQGYLWFNGRRLDEGWRRSLKAPLQNLLRSAIMTNDAKSADAQTWNQVVGLLLSASGFDLAADAGEAIYSIGNPFLFLDYIVSSLVDHASEASLLEVENLRRRGSSTRSSKK